MEAGIVESFAKTKLRTGPATVFNAIPVFSDSRASSIRIDLPRWADSQDDAKTVAQSTSRPLYRIPHRHTSLHIAERLQPFPALVTVTGRLRQLSSPTPIPPMPD